MTDFSPPPDPPLAVLPEAAAPEAVVSPWQARFEAIAALLVAVVAFIAVSGVVAAYAQSRDLQGVRFGGLDWGDIVRQAGSNLGLSGAGALLIAYLLVTLGPDQAIGGRGVAVLRGCVVVGLIAAGISGFAAIAQLFEASDPFSGGESSFLHRVADASPMAAAAAVAGYVAWCAFATLGETTPPPLFEDEAPTAG